MMSSTAQISQVYSSNVQIALQWKHINKCLWKGLHITQLISYQRLLYRRTSFMSIGQRWSGADTRCSCETAIPWLSWASLNYLAQGRQINNHVNIKFQLLLKDISKINKLKFQIYRSNEILADKDVNIGAVRTRLFDWVINIIIAVLRNTDLQTIKCMTPSRFGQILGWIFAFINFLAFMM